MGFPTTIDSLPGTATSGTTQLSDGVLDHALQHRTYGSVLIGLENFLGTSAASNGLFNSFAAGQTPLPVQNGTLGTVIAAGTFNLFQGGTLQGTIQNNALFNGGTYGTIFVNGGTLNMSVGTIGTLAGGSLTTGNFQTGQFMRMGSNSQNFYMQFGQGSIINAGTTSAFAGTLTYPTSFNTIIGAWASGGGVGSLGGHVIQNNEYVSIDTIGTTSSRILITSGNITSNLSAGTYYYSWVAIGF